MQTKLLQISEKAKMIIFKNTKQNVHAETLREHLHITNRYNTSQISKYPWGTSTHTKKFHKNLIINSYIARI